MPQFETIVPTTELEAVNTMLRAVGEAPISDLDTAAAAEADIALAVQTLRDIMREVQLFGWRFNTEFEYRIAIDGNDQFPVPSDLLSFDASKRSDQCGYRPQKNDDGTLPFTNLLDIDVKGGFFWDRLRSQDTFDATERPQIFIDAVFSRDFTDMPESARNYCVKRAARQFAESTLGEPQIVGYTNDDIAQAYRNLKKDQKADRRRNMLDSVRSYNIVGRRQLRARYL